MRVATSIAIFLGLLSGPGYAACNLDDIGARLSQGQMFYSFQQSKTIEALSRPLFSSGMIWMSPQHELVWQVRTPIKSTTVINIEGVREFNRNDVLQPQINDEVAGDLSSLFLNLLSGNFIALENTFDQSLSCEQDQWTLLLTPADSTFSNLLSSLSVSGEQYLEQVVYQEVRGDQTVIALVPSDEVPDFEIYLEN